MWEKNKHTELSLKVAFFIACCPCFGLFVTRFTWSPKWLNSSGSLIYLNIG